MKIRFDSLNRFETPKFLVCNPGSTYKDGLVTGVIGCLSDTTDEELVFNFNAASELNFRINKVRRDNQKDNSYVLNLYCSLKNRRLIFIEDVGFFIITSVNDGYENGNHFKDVHAESCEQEIAHKMLPYIKDGTHLFMELLEKIVSVLPMWTIGYVDPAIAEKYRTFEDIGSDTNALSFLRENIQDAYECICLFDIINRQINVYDQNNYVERTSVHITKEDAINSIDISESSEDLYTAMSVLGDDNLNIAPVNPLGTSVIYNFDYYLSWMSEHLGNKVREWQNLISSQQSQYYDLNLQYYEKLTSKTNLQSEIDKLETQLTMYRRCRDNIVADGSTDNVNEYNEAIASCGGTPVDISLEINEMLYEIDDLIAITQDAYTDTQSELDSVVVDLELIDISIVAIQDSVSMDRYFTQAEYDELYNYIFEGSYNDEYITVTDSMTYSEKFHQMKVLYDRAVSQLERISKPTQEFSIDVENFLFAKEFEAVSDQLETGCLINVELDDNDVAELFLSTITVNYDDRSLSLKFGNRFNKFDPKTLFEGVLGNIKKSANTIEYIKDVVHPIKSGEFNAMKEALEISRTLTMNAALTSANEEVIIDGSGYTGRKLLESGEYDPHQVKLTGRSLVFTDDAWKSSKVALGELILGDGQVTYGINAQTLIGDMIMGNSLHIMDDQGNDLLTVIDGRIATGVSDHATRLSQIEQTASEVSIQLTQINNDINELENREINSVTTTTGYTFNEDGLIIHKSGEEITNLLDNTGMYVRRGADSILVANNEGVDAINLTANQYLVVGRNARFENYSNGTDENRTGCFYIGSAQTIALTDGGDM